jgi:hypothetical protein
VFFVILSRFLNLKLIKSIVRRTVTAINGYHSILTLLLDKNGFRGASPSCSVESEYDDAASSDTAASRRGQDTVSSTVLYCTILHFTGLYCALDFKCLCRTACFSLLSSMPSKEPK